MILNRFSCPLITVSDLFPETDFCSSSIANQQLFLNRSISLSLYFLFFSFRDVW